MSADQTGAAQLQREKVYRLTIVVLVGALIATWVAVVWLIQGKNTADDEVDKSEDELAAYTAGPDAQAAAERILGEMVSYDFREMNSEYEWTKYLADDDLRTDYEDRLTPKLEKVIRKSKSSAEGDVVRTAYNILDEDQVQVIAFIRQKLTTAQDRKGVIDEQWTSLTMVRDGDEWLIEKITPFDVPPSS